MMRLSHFILLMGTLMGSGLAIGQTDNSEGEADASTKAPETPLDGYLSPIEWGMNPDSVLEKVRGEIEGKWAKKLKEADTLNMDKFLKLKRGEIESLEKSFTRFLGQKTGYESSVVGAEFRVRNGESMLLVKRGAESHFLFFRDESLWKLCIVRDAGIGDDFASFIKRLTAKLKKAGPPQKKADGDGEAFVWRSESTVLQTIDKSDFFNAYVLRLVQAGRGEAIEEEHAQSPKQEKTISSRESQGLLDSIVEGDDEEEEPEDDVVDQLTGVDHQVDLVTGRPAYAEPMESPVIGDDLRSVKTTPKSKKGKSRVQKRKKKRRAVKKAIKKKKKKKTLLKGESENGIVY